MVYVLGRENTGQSGSDEAGEMALIGFSVSQTLTSLEQLSCQLLWLFVMHADKDKGPPSGLAISIPGPSTLGTGPPPMYKLGEHQVLCTVVRSWLRKLR